MLWNHPQMLWWALPAAAIIAWFHVRSLSDFSMVQRWTSTVIRLAVALLLIVALGDPILIRSTDDQMLVVAVDRSESIDTAAAEQADRWLDQLSDQTLQRGIEMRVVEFADQPAALRKWQNNNDEPIVAPEQDDLSSTPSPTPTKPDDDESEPPFGTDLAAAIATASASIPPTMVPTILVMSDGNDTTGGDPAAAIQNPSVAVSAMPLPVRSDPEIQLASVMVPGSVRQGEPFYVEVLVNSNVDCRGEIDLYRGDIRIDDQSTEPLTIKKGENRFRFRQSVQGRRQETFAARVRAADDTMLGNNQASAVVTASGRPRVLWIDADVDQTDSIRWALDEQSIDVEVRPPDGIPNELTEIQNYEAIVLSNVPATAMTLRQMDLIQIYVRDLGGGLIMLGGDQSFGLGGYYRTRIEEILPVRSNFEKEREKPSLAMMLVIDKSGSMGGEKIELAKDAAIAAAELLGPRDSLGVVAFDGSAYMVADLQSATNQNAIIGDISTIDASGGTNMYPAMTMAYESLASAPAKLKHVILMTDGVSTPGDFQGAADDMAASRITLSTVALGQGASEDLLEELANIGGGRYYFCDDPGTVPQVFAKETVEAGQSAINELPFIAQPIRPTQVLRGIDMELSPLLLGYVVTRPKPTAEFILATEAGDPLLCWWRFGLGMSVAFTSDAKNRWAGEWLAWPDFGNFWAKIIRHTMRKQDDGTMNIQMQRRGETTLVQLDVIDDNGRFVDAAPTLTAIDPSLGQSRLPMTKTGPGRFETSVPTPQRGTYYFDVLADDKPSGSSPRVSRGLAVGYPDELRLMPLGEKTLRRIATTGGGRYDPTANFESLLDPGKRTARQPKPLWPLLLSMALALFVVDVGVRRIEFLRSSGRR